MRTPSRLSSRAIVLSRENFGEADQYIQLLTQNWGVITVLAKSARKSKRRYVGGLDIFCHNEVFLRGDPKERPYLIELAVLNSFPGMRDNFEKMMVGGKVVQWVRRLADVATPMPAVYSLLGQTLALIEKETRLDRLELLTLLFKLKLLSTLGLKPRLDACVRCGEEVVEILFDIPAGGAVCRRCGPREHSALGEPLSNEERNFLVAGDQLRLTHWDNFDFALDKSMALSRMLTQFASYHTHQRLPV